MCEANTINVQTVQRLWLKIPRLVLPGLVQNISFDTIVVEKSFVFIPLSTKVTVLHFVNGFYFF